MAKKRDRRLGVTRKLNLLLLQFSACRNDNQNNLDNQHDNQNNLYRFALIFGRWVGGGDKPPPRGCVQGNKRTYCCELRSFGF